MKEKLKQIDAIYDAFEGAVASCKTDAACRKGCAFLLHGYGRRSRMLRAGLG